MLFTIQHLQARNRLIIRAYPTNCSTVLPRADVRLIAAEEVPDEDLEALTEQSQQDRSSWRRTADPGSRGEIADPGTHRRSSRRNHSVGRCAGRTPSRPAEAHRRWSGCGPREKAWKPSEREPAACLKATVTATASAVLPIDHLTRPHGTGFQQRRDEAAACSQSHLRSSDAAATHLPN